MKPESRFRLPPRARVALRRSWSLDGLFIAALIIFIVASIFTSVNVLRLVNDSRLSLSQHRQAEAAVNRAQILNDARNVAAIIKLEALVRRELARSLRRHDQKAAVEHAEMLAAIERLLNRPTTVRIVEDGKRVVIEREPEPCRGRECRRRP